jgi:hypothetical protein
LGVSTPTRATTSLAASVDPTEAPESRPCPRCGRHRARALNLPAGCAAAPERGRDEPECVAAGPLGSESPGACAGAPPRRVSGKGGAAKGDPRAAPRKQALRGAGLSQQAREPAELRETAGCGLQRAWPEPHAGTAELTRLLTTGSIPRGASLMPDSDSAAASGSHFLGKSFSLAVSHCGKVLRKMEPETRAVTLP